MDNNRKRKSNKMGTRKAGERPRLDARASEREGTTSCSDRQWQNILCLGGTAKREKGEKERNTNFLRGKYAER